MKTHFSIIFLFVFCLVSSQQKLYSNFNFPDYKTLKFEYLNKVEKSKEEIVFQNHYFFIKKKLDSVWYIRDEIKRNELIKNGFKSEEITDSYLRQVDNNLYLKHAYFIIHEKDFYYYYSKDLDELHIIKNNGEKINYYFQGSTNSEYINNADNSIRTENFYFKNSQLKETKTFLLPSNEQIGIYEEYDESGKLLMHINYDKDFKIKQKNLIALVKKNILPYFIKHIVYIQPELSNSKAEEIAEYFIMNSNPIINKGKIENKAVWSLTYERNSAFVYNIVIDECSLKVIDFKIIDIIE